jgi:hypothetical protein
MLQWAGGGCPNRFPAAQDLLGTSCAQPKPSLARDAQPDADSGPDRIRIANIRNPISQAFGPACTHN